MSAWLLVPIAGFALWLVLAILRDVDDYFRTARQLRRLDEELDP